MGQNRPSCRSAVRVPCGRDGPSASPRVSRSTKPGGGSPPPASARSRSGMPIARTASPSRTSTARCQSGSTSSRSIRREASASPAAASQSARPPSASVSARASSCRAPSEAKPAPGLLQQGADPDRAPRRAHRSPRPARPGRRRETPDAPPCPRARLPIAFLARRAAGTDPPAPALQPCEILVQAPQPVAVAVAALLQGVDPRALGLRLLRRPGGLSAEVVPETLPVLEPILGERDRSRTPDKA
jgi:hypothetical protein